MDWNAYEPYMPLVRGPLRTLARNEATAEFEQLMSARAVRVSSLAELVHANGFELSPSDVGLQRLQDWLVHEIEGDPQVADRLGSYWYGVINDIGLFIGEVIIDRTRNVHWEMVTKPPTDVAYQKHVLTGFRDSEWPGYYVDVDGIVSSLAHSVVIGESVDDNEFVALVRHSVSLDA